LASMTCHLAGSVFTGGTYVGIGLPANFPS
jgi:hypothetical protein